MIIQALRFSVKKAVLATGYTESKYNRIRVQTCYH